MQQSLKLYERKNSYHVDLEEYYMYVHVHLLSKVTVLRLTTHTLP